ncbi:MAG: hypothetical protein P8183_12145 [Anaerolineae bacterium]
MSVRTKILGIVLVLVALLGVGITVQVRIVLQNALVSKLQEQSVSIARDVAARATDLILINDLFALHQLLVETQTNNPDVRYAFIVNEEGEIIDIRLAVVSQPVFWQRMPLARMPITKPGHWRRIKGGFGIRPCPYSVDKPA